MKNLVEVDRVREGFGRWERKGRGMGVLKGWKAGKKGKITQQCLKCAIEKWLNDGKKKMVKIYPDVSK